MDQKKAVADWNKYVNGSRKYEDSTFPARKDYMLYWKDYLDKNSLTTVNGSYDGRAAGYKDVTKFMRPSEIVQNPSLWGNSGVSFTGIKQGGLGNCYVLASAAALAEYPERIHKLFYNKSYSRNGIFMVTYYVRGDAVKIVIDDRLALYPNRRDKRLYNS